MIKESSNYWLDSCLEKKYVEAAISSVKDGSKKHFIMYADDFIREFASDEDYSFWLKMKKASL